MARTLAVLLILTFVLKAPTSDIVQLTNCIPELQEYPAGHDDLIKS